MAKRVKIGLVLTVSVIILVLAAQANRKNADQAHAYQLQLQSEVQESLEQGNQRFVWPLAQRSIIQGFAEFGKVSRFPNKFHAAADYFAHPGAEVYAIADGQISFNGELGGYGGLIIVNHQDTNLHSLYGHLSLTRWMTDKTHVKQGELIGYVADVNESYGIGIIPHLHFTIRLGHQTDYASIGRGNWSAGYTDRHPSTLDYLDPEWVFGHFTKANFQHALIQQ